LLNSLEQVKSAMDLSNRPQTPTKDDTHILESNLEKLVGSVQDSPEDIVREEAQEQLPYEYHHEHDTGQFFRSAAKVYVTSNNCTFTMLAMCHGYSEFEAFLGSADLKAVMSKAKGKGFGSFGLDNLLLRKEACRRQYFVLKAFETMKQQNPQLSKKDNPLLNPTTGKLFLPSKNWKRDDLLTFLSKHRLDDNRKDLDFLRGKISELRQEISEAKESLGIESLWEKRDWRGLTPWIRLCMVVDHDSLRTAYLGRHDQKSRQELDGRKTDKVPESYWKQATDLFNSDSWAPKSYALDGWGTCFETSHDLSWTVLNDLGVKKLDEKNKDGKGEEFKKRYGIIKQNWDTMYQRYQDSGQGKEAVSERQRVLVSDTATRGGANDDELSSSESDALVAREPEGAEDVILAGGDRLDYLHDRPIQTMYFWYVLLVNGLLGRARSQVNQEYAVEGGHVPSVFPSDKQVPKSAQKGRASLASNRALEDSLEEEREFRRQQKEQMDVLIRQGERGLKQNEVGNLSLQIQNFISDAASTSSTLASIRTEYNELVKAIEVLEDTLVSELDLPDLRRELLQRRLDSKKKEGESLEARIGELENDLCVIKQRKEVAMAQLEEAGAVVKGQKLNSKRPRRSKSSVSDHSNSSSRARTHGRGLVRAYASANQATSTDEDASESSDSDE
jgi:hypothetical protein